jgi:hypothetical protein
MGSVLHGIAATTPRIRKEIQDAQESLETLAKRYQVNEKVSAALQSSVFT